MEQRRTRRFQLELPVSITRTGSLRVMLAGRTKNISSAGVLFTAAKEADLGGAIEYMITLNHENVEPVQLRCIGKVVRMTRADSGNNDRSYEIAATLERYEFVRERSRVLAKSSAL
jgi:hypothetical protein